jgi:hypothetical protein
MSAVAKKGTKEAPIRRSIPGALSDKECRAAYVPEGKTELTLHDGAGLYLRVRLSGLKTWFYLYGSGEARQRVAGPAPFPELTLAAARLWAAKQRDMVRTNAADPAQQAHEHRVALEAARTQTLEAMMQAVWEDMKERGQPSWANTRSVFNHTPAWARRLQPIHVTRDHAERLLREVRTATLGTKVAKQYQAALSAAYTRAQRARAGLNEKRLNPALAAYAVRENPFTEHDLGIETGVSKRHLTREEAQEFHRRLLLEPQTDERDLLLMVMYVGGQRAIQMAGATIAVDPETQAPCLLLLDRKQKGDEPRPHVMPLQGPALELLASRGMLSEGDSIFGVTYEESYELSRAAGVLCDKIVRQWRRELARAGRPALCAFSKKAIRSTASTAMASVGIGEPVVNLVLSHGQKSIDWKHYNRWEFLDQKREALVAWQRWLAEPAPTPVLAAEAGRVIPLRRKAA